MTYNGPKKPRIPGTRVFYSPIQTARYVSRFARLQRGQLLTPSRVLSDGDGGFFYDYLSARGPAFNQGYWRVTVSGGAGPGIPDPGEGNYNSGEGNMPGAQCSARYRFDWSLQYSRNGGPDETLTRFGFIRFGPFGRFKWDVVPFNAQNVNIRVKLSNFGTLPFGAFIEDEIIDQTVVFVGNGGSAVVTSNVQIDNLVEINFPIPTPTGNPADACGVLNWTSPPAPPQDPNGGAGYVPGGGGGDRIYSCTCPDFRRQEFPYHRPVYPSNVKQRDWTNSGAGAVAQGTDPRWCKHIIATARYIGGLNSLVTPTSYLNDIPTYRYYFPGNPLTEIRRRERSRLIRERRDADRRRYDTYRARGEAGRASRLARQLNNWNRYYFAGTRISDQPGSGFDRRVEDEFGIVDYETDYYRLSQIGRYDNQFSEKSFQAQFRAANLAAEARDLRERQFAAQVAAEYRSTEGLNISSFRNSAIGRSIERIFQ